MKIIPFLSLLLTISILSCNGCDDDMMPCTSPMVDDILIINNGCDFTDLDPDDNGVMEVFKVVEDMPVFPGCEDIENKQERKRCADSLMFAFVEEHKIYPTEALGNNVEGIAVVRFLVSTSGCLDYIEVVREPGCGLGVEAQRIVNEMPDWNPGKQRGVPVVVQYNLPVVFELD